LPAGCDRSGAEAVSFKKHQDGSEALRAFDLPANPARLGGFEEGRCGPPATAATQLERVTVLYSRAMRVRIGHGSNPKRDWEVDLTISAGSRRLDADVLTTNEIERLIKACSGGLPWQTVEAAHPVPLFLLDMCIVGRSSRASLSGHLVDVYHPGPEGCPDGSVSHVLGVSRGALLGPYARVGASWRCGRWRCWSSTSRASYAGLQFPEGALGCAWDSGRV
jgi:hypothetical protein